MDWVAHLTDLLTLGPYRQVYNVYSQEIDPSNMMPANPHQKPHHEQAYKLSTERVPSAIPKGGTDGTWTYPSPQANLPIPRTDVVHAWCDQLVAADVLQCAEAEGEGR